VLLQSQVLDGVPPALADALRPTSPSGINFTPREREILALLGAGHTNDEIASRLGISPRTVETHRAHVVTKIGGRSRAALISAARDAGLSG
jgi:DNA-binding CsgD family transcriptional regulator